MRLPIALSLILVALLTACGGAVQPTATSAPEGQVSPTLPPAPAATSTPAPSPTDTPPPTEVIPSPSPTKSPSPPPTSEPLSWYDGESLALLAVGDYEQADLYALRADGTTQEILAGVGSEVAVSPQGRWLGFYRRDPQGRVTLELRDAQADESRTLTDVSGDMFSFAFDPAGRRLAYLDLGSYTDQGVPWALVVRSLDSDVVARYEARMVDSETRPLPGSPVGWSGAAPDGEELIFDTFVPGTEAGWMGVWGVTLPADGSSASLDSLPLRELVPGVPVYTSRVHLAPDRQRLAYLGRDPEYYPENYAPEFYDLAVNRLEITALSDGARTLLVRADDGSALGRALEWSPDGQRLLFAQGFYEGENFVTLSLKSTDLSGTTVEYGPLTLPPLGGLLELAWCEPSLALYSTWNGSDGTQRLYRFDLNTGQSTEVSAGQRVGIVGCAP